MLDKNINCYNHAMYVKNKINSFSGLGNYYGQTETPVQQIDNALPISIGVDTKEVKELPKSANDFIPKHTPRLNWMQSRKYLRRPPNSAPKTTPVAKMHGGVYWTASGPKFSQSNIKEGSQAVSVSAPETVWKPSITVVRDKPQISLPPIEMPAVFNGLGEIPSSVKIGVPVLCLIVGAFLLYRRK